MSPTDESPLSAELAGALARDEAGPFPVVVTFGESAPADELARLGLYGPIAGAASAIAFGRLERDDLERLGRELAVVDIQRSEALPPQGPPPSAGPFGAKVDPLLATRLEHDPATPLGVVVTFVAPPGPGVLAELGLAGGSSTLASGVCTPEAIGALARRPDVDRIDSIAEPDLHGS